MVELKDIKGEISLSRANGGRYNETPIHIEIRDSEARVYVANIRMSLEEFGKLVSGGQSECFFDVVPEHLQKIGTIREHKKEMVPEAIYAQNNALTWGQNKRLEADIALKPFEVDGWVGDRNDYGNHHRSHLKEGKEYFDVNFHRNVPKVVE